MAGKPTYEELELKVRELEKLESQRKRTEEELHKYKMIVSSSSDHLALLDKNYVYQLVNDAYLKGQNKKLEDIVGHSVPELFGQEFFEKNQKANIDRCLSGETVKYQLWVTFPSLGRRYLEVFHYPYYEADGSISGYAVNARDATDRKQAEEALQKERLFLQKAQEIGHVGTWELDLQKNKLRWTDETYRIFGLQPETELTYETFLNCIHPDDREYVDKQWKAALEQKPYDIEHRILAGGIVKWVREKAEIEFNEKNGHVRGIGFTQDITDRKQAEEALRESEEKFRTLVEQSPLGITLIGKDGRYKYVNPRFQEIFGYSIDDVPTGAEWFKKAFPDKAYRRYVVKSWNEDHRHGEIGISRPRAYTVTCKDGACKEIQFRPVTMENLDQLVIYEDITESKHAETKLKESEQRFRELFNNMSSGVAIYDSPDDGQSFLLRDLNRAGLEYGQTPHDKVVGREVRKVFPGLEELGLLNVFKRVWQTGEAEHLPCRMYKDEQLVFWIETYVCKLPSGELVAIFDDNTAQKKAEEDNKKLEIKLIQAQKMESIGTLAGGIAHDFNNLLSPIMIHSEMAMMELPDDSPVRQNLRHIYKAAERARDLVKQILTFARRRKEERIPLKASMIVKEVVKFLRSTIPSTIDIRYQFNTKQDTVYADPTQMNQIVMNLCTNSAHAMREKGGVLEVSLDHESIGSNEKSQFAGLSPGHYLKLTVSDTGHGISPGIVDKIFEPYFTTKAPGEGTGLGLAMVHGIVKSYDGDIKVESKPGKGTAFHVLIPVIAEDDYPVIPPKTELPKGNERILFVDDEKEAVDAIQTMLKRLGYKVTPRTSGIEAIEAFRNRPDAFDLVITDMTMPNMTGKELARELLTIRSETPIILCTGFSELIDEKRAKEMGIRAFVMKPIVMGEMAKVIRAVLAEK